MKLLNKVALVTGSSSGIGYATALALAREGANIAVNYFHNKQGAQEVADKIKALGRQVLIFKADVSNSNEVNEMIRTVVDRFKRIDILVNNAGSHIQRSSVLEMTENLWDRTIDVNLKSVFLCSKAVIKIMLKQGSGRIINISSISAQNGGGRGATAYAAAKAGEIAFTKGLAKEVALSGITVNAITPGCIDTPIHKKFSTPEVIKQTIQLVPLRRIGRPEEVAAVVVFLSSDEASYIIGETINVNGGWLMR